MEKEFFEKLNKHCMDFGLGLNEVLFEKIFYIINNNIPILKYENPYKVKPVTIYLTEEILAYLEEFTLKNNVNKRDVYYTAMKSLEEDDLKKADQYSNDIALTKSSNNDSKTNLNSKNNIKSNLKHKTKNHKKDKSRSNKNNKSDTNADSQISPSVDDNIKSSASGSSNNLKKTKTQKTKKTKNNKKTKTKKTKNNKKTILEDDNSILSMKTDLEGNISVETITNEEYNLKKLKNNKSQKDSKNSKKDFSPKKYLSSFDSKAHLFRKYGALIEEYEMEYKNNKINRLIKDFDKDKDLKLFDGEFKTIRVDSLSTSLKKEFEESKDFFNNICGHKLDDYQRLAAIADDDNLQIIAGAGTGKTLTLISKVKYLIQIKGVDPRRILCLSFNSSSASELREKLENELGRFIETKTFHSLGLKIIGSFDKNIKSRSMDYDRFFIAKFKNSLTISEMEDMIKLGYDIFHISKYAFEDLISSRQNLSREDKIFEEYNFVLSQCPLPGLIEDFMESFKRKNYSFDQFYSFYTDPYYFSINDYSKDTIENRHRFLDIVFKFYLEYELYLLRNNMVDFSDMINKSIGLVELLGLKYSYDYILIDEYQDTSYLNYKLIRAIKDKTNSKIVVVGDDWQSIYGFRDTNVELFTEFPKYFKNPTIVFTNETYRNSQELIDVASNFVLSNTKQIKKNLVSNVPTENPPIKVSYISGNDKSKNDILSKIIFDLTENYPGSTLYILARNKDIIKKYLSKNSFNAENIKQIGKSNNLKIIYPENSDIKNSDKLNINFKTIHASKGLEADNVIILLDDKFPSTRSSHSLLNYVSSDYDFSSKKANEERRLFYVALSRTRNNVYIISELFNKSDFMRELEDFWDLNKFKNSFEIYYNCDDNKN